MKIERNKNYAFKFMLRSGDGDDYPGCKLNIVLFGWSITFNLPPVIKPGICKVRGQYNYDEFIESRYGAYLFDNHFNFCYGRGDANFHRDIFGAEQRWSCFLPWNEWRFVRHSLYDLNGDLFWGDQSSKYKEMCEVRENIVPKKTFVFKDYDGEIIKATTFIEEREWRRGEGWFKWLSKFYKSKKRRDLSIEFNKETGKRKGSWKGGTIGTSIDMEQDELHEEAFKRYCLEHSMNFLTVEK